MLLNHVPRATLRGRDRLSAAERRANQPITRYPGKGIDPLRLRQDSCDDYRSAKHYERHNLGRGGEWIR